MKYTRIAFTIRMSAIGDVIIASRALFLLAKQNYYPVFVTSLNMISLAKRVVGLDAFICLEKGQETQFFLYKNQVTKDEFENHLKSLSVEMPPVLLDLQKTSRSVRAEKEVKRLLNVKFDKKFTVQKRTLYRIFLIFLSRLCFFQKTNGHFERDKVVPISSLQEAVIKKMMKQDRKEFQSLPKQFIFFEKKINSVVNPYVCLFPGGSAFIKMWPKENFRSLIRLILEQTHYHVMICGSEKEEYLGEYLDFPKQDRIHNLVNKTNLDQILDLISGASYVVSNDSFAAHAADALHIPASMIFGATSPKFGFVPNFDKIKIEYENLACSPCTRHGSGDCRFKNLKCLKDVKAQSILNHLRESTHQGALEK